MVRRRPQLNLYIDLHGLGDSAGERSERGGGHSGSSYNKAWILIIQKLGLCGLCIFNCMFVLLSVKRKLKHV